ncbi:MAG: M20/M25/M40 family metallo-hydrolase [Elainellaceae cyanobacterium]
MDLKHRLRSHLEQIVRERNPYIASEGHFYVREYVRTELAQWGKVEVHEFQVQGQPHQNLVLNLPAQDSNSNGPPILIGAHYDAVPGSPGADDNATGVAGMLELARFTKAHPLRYPTRFVAFDMEEYGMLGSEAYATDLKQQRQALRLMLSLEMIGYCDPTPGSQHYPAGLQAFYPNRGDFIGLIGNVSTLPDLMTLSHHIKQVGVPCEWLPAGQRGLIVPQTRLSDHAPFWDRDYRAIMVTDTSFMRNPHYHLGSDRLDTLDLDFLAGVCQGLGAGLQKL